MTETTAQPEAANEQPGAPAAGVVACAAGDPVPHAAGATERFYRDLPTFSAFDATTDPASYVPVPDDWMLGLADVVTSTAAIAAGRYKSVNTAGAAVISAVSNALGTLDFPFVFNGDGASFAVGPGDAERARQALAATVSWVGAELDLILRGATVSVREVRAAGHDLKVARFAASDDVSYAMFSGGGRAWAERRMKAGALRLPPAPPGARPDLSGLSCRFRNIPAANGVILSLIALPVAGTDDARFLAVVADVLSVVAVEPRGAHPVPTRGPDFRWPPGGLGMEARLSRPRGRSLGVNRVVVALRTLFSAYALRPGTRLGSFSADTYKSQLVHNSDFRKFDDGLMMTLDCSLATADGIERRLARARDAGVVRFGLHRQSEAMVTCVVPSALKPGHVHFVDGAAGGYAVAARDLKAAPS